jgi:hypothetical protein
MLSKKIRSAIVFCHDAAGLNTANRRTMGKKAAPKKLTVENVAVYNKGEFRKDLSQPHCYHVSTKAKVSTPRCKSKKRRCSYQPEFRGEGGGLFASEAAAWEHALAFAAMVNGERPPSKRLQEATAGTPKQPAAAGVVSELDAVLKAKRADSRRKVAEAQRGELYTALRRKSRSSAATVVSFVESLTKVCGLKSQARAELMAKAVLDFAAAEKGAVTAANAQRQEQRSGKVTTEKRKNAKAMRPAHQRKIFRSRMKRLIKWEAARDHLGPFIAADSTEGLARGHTGRHRHVCRRGPVDFAEDETGPSTLFVEVAVHVPGGGHCCVLRDLASFGAHGVWKLAQAIPRNVLRTERLSGNDKGEVGQRAHVRQRRIDVCYEDLVV